MIMLGETYHGFQAALAMSSLSIRDKMALKKYFEAVWNDAEFDDPKSFVIERCNLTELFGGNYYIVEDRKEDFQFMVDYGCQKLNLMPFNGNAFDVSFYLNQQRDLAVGCVMTNNGGGSTFIITKEIFKKYKTAAFHFANTTIWKED